MKYTNNRNKCWDRLTKAIKVSVFTSDYIIDPDTFHDIKAMFFALADKPKITNSGLINKNQTTSGLVDKPKEECKHKWQIGPTTNYEVQCKKCGALKPFSVKELQDERQGE